MDEERIISPELENSSEEKLENSLRPKTLDEYIGQDKVKENMKIYIEAVSYTHLFSRYDIRIRK